MTQRLTLIGFGEAGETFAHAAAWRDRACAFDIDPGRAAAMESAGVTRAATAANALDGAPLALSLVTADQALAAAKDCAASIEDGTIWCDMNSVAPDTKRRVAAIIEAAGGSYVDGALLAPVKPAGMAVPLLLAGPDAQAAEQALTATGFTDIRIVGEKVGRASAIKMVRSVMVKGIEALTDEMMAAAEAAGIAEEVLASLDTSEPTGDWRARAKYNLERMEAHGARRAAEMEESANTLRSLGVEPLMTEGTIARQRAAGERGAQAGETPEAMRWRAA